MTDKDDLLAAMYTIDDKPSQPVEQSNPRSRKIRVGIIEYEVPSMAYVQHLEQIVMQQANELARQQRALDRISALLYGTRNFLRRQTDPLQNRRTRMPEL